MKVVIDGVVHDSMTTPILIIFEESSKHFSGMTRFVSAPPDTTVEEREKIINMEVI